MDDEYAGICGITREELETQMSANVDVLAEKMDKSREQALEARTATRLYLFELKLNKDADAAMKQINLKEYPKRFALSGLPIVKVGVNFDVATHNITDWKIEYE